MAPLKHCSRPRVRALAAAIAMIAAAPFCAPARADGAAAPIVGDRPISSMPENDDVRIAAWPRLVEGPRAQALAYPGTTARNGWGAWSVSVVDGADAFYVVFAAGTGGGPLYAQGGWILKRSAADGSVLQAKVFVRSDPGTFVRLYPYGSRSRIDVVAYGGVLYNKVIVPLPFDELLRSPFSRIVGLTSDVIDWSLFSPDPALYRDLRGLMASVRAGLPSLRYADDGAIDSGGRAVLISTLESQAEPVGLNCSGFVKWLVDGMLHPITGAYLSVGALKERMLDSRGSSFTSGFEERYDPFFGLDWSRALARAAWSAFYPSLRGDSPLANDVAEAPFALRVADADPVNGGSAYEPYSDNFDDAGFDVRGLKAVLFMLASSEPGRFYLAQFNARDPEPPNLRRYYHIAALFPYFDEDGAFRVAVFESAAETSLDAVARRGYEFVKLVRMPAASRFEPQALDRP
ncbi:MAG TPA: hypothetical protein P5298_08720 [Spirochaetia bacterium]|nr:hypothetical protein [Spirochaetaceae bacterium]HPE88779.1 hypothetical protein [Spirochaetales bacterium]HRW24480.1 hypothetical protein [Spirochaetia bacterium]